MARIKKGAMKQFEKVMSLMLSGEPIAVSEFETLLSKEIEMYRLSAYMLGIKYTYKGVIKTTKDGRRVLTYQLTNANEVKAKFEKSFPDYAKYASKVKAKGDVNKLSDLKAKPVKDKEEKKETLEVTEITES